MEVGPVSNQSFGIYINTKDTKYGRILHGIYKGLNVDVYISENKGELRHKLFYVHKNGEWLKSKLEYYTNNIKSKVIYSDARKEKRNGMQGKKR